MEQLTDVIILAPDQQTARYLTSTIAPSDSNTAIVTHRGWEKRATAALQKNPTQSAERPILIIVPSDHLGAAPLALAQTCNAQQGLTLVWAQTSSLRDSTWLLLQLLQSEDAVVCESLDVLVQTAHIFHVTRGASFCSVEHAPVKSALTRHLSVTVAKTSFTIDNSETMTAAKPRLPKIKVDKNARIILALGKHTYPMNASPSVVGDALFLLCTHFQQELQPIKNLKIVPEDGVIEMIARPPARILSETTSKRLLSAFGLHPPNEALCDSPSKAVRFSKELHGAATLKLVRPNFRFKSTAGAVIQHVNGPSEIQKAYQSLMTLSDTLGNPKALGILVSEQIVSEQLFWIDAKQNDTFGRIIRFGKQDQVNESPDGALPLPCSLAQCTNALQRTYPALSPTACTYLAEAIYRFSIMINTLSNHVGLAQIHPVAITERGALMLDAVIGITNFVSGHKKERFSQ